MVNGRDDKFYSELKQLNDDLIEYLTECQKKSPFFDYGPTLSDYIKQLAELNKQYPEKNGSSDPPLFNVTSPLTTNQNSFIFAPPSTGASALLASSASPMPSNTNSTPSLFTSPLASVPAATTTPVAASSSTATNTSSTAPQMTFGTAAPFSFTSPFAPLKSTGSTFTLPTVSSATTTTASATTTAPTFTFGTVTSSTTLGSTAPFGSATPFGSASPFAPLKTISNPVETVSNSADPNEASESPNEGPGDSGEAPGDAEQEAAPLDKYEEPDSQMTLRCKLYGKTKSGSDESSLKLLGIGNLYVKTVEPNQKLQVIFRLEPDYKRVLMNEVISSDIPVKITSKAVHMVFPDPPNGTKMFIAKTKEDSEAKQLFDILKPDPKKQ